jgi:DNA helicase II / ATP-dependent DNA helicase PcrA
LPRGIILEELRNYVWADADEQQTKVLEEVYERLNLSLPAAGLLPQRIRIMTMHGAKGLSSDVVIIPGLEDEILPGPRRKPYPGLVLEAARLLYVSITRVRVACMVSYARRRFVYGKASAQHSSRFNVSLDGPFFERNEGLNTAEAREIADL